MEKKVRVTMADVARAANVTTQTVSRAFRNTPDISEETRERILKIAAQLNYVMNNTASSLRGGNSRLIVVVYDNLTNVYFSIMIDYLQNCLREKGYSILVLSVAEARLNRSAYEFAVSHNAAGVISFLEPDDEIETLIQSFQLPVLLLGRRTRLNNVDYLCTCDEQGGRLAAEKLIAKGAKRMAFITIDISVSCAHDRYKGFSEAVTAYGFPQPVVVDAYSGPLEENLIKLFSNPATIPDGIFCFNDMIAFDVLYFLEKNGVKAVPIVGYDCIQQELHFPNRITSVGPNKQELAARATEIIISDVESNERTRKTETAEVFLYESN